MQREGTVDLVPYLLLPYSYFAQGSATLQQQQVSIGGMITLTRNSFEVRTGKGVYLNTSFNELITE